MRILLFLISLGMYSGIITAQQGFELTINSSANFSFIANQNDFEETSQLPQTSFGNSSLITVGHNFSKTLGIATGLGFTYLRQNYLKTSSSKQLKVLREKSHRALTYVRLPFMLRISSSPKQPVQFFLRFGPHLDALLTATSRTEFAFNSGQSDEKINYRGQFDSQEEPLDVFKQFSLGLSLDVGTKIQLSEQFDLLLLAHAESSLTNLESQDAPNFFPASFRKIGLNDYALVRKQTFGVMVGLTVGLVYKIPSNSNFYQPRSRYRNRYWKAQ